MKTLVTGAKGMLGLEVCRVLSSSSEVFPVDIEEMDIKNRAQVHQTMATIKPDLVIHLAAMTDVDGCEQKPKQAMAINIEGTKNVATEAAKLKAQFIYISTSDIFDGRKKTPYNEDDKPNPINHYGRSKYQGERQVTDIIPEPYIIRTCWLFGGGPQDKKFVAKILKLAQTKNIISAVNDVFGSPTYTRDLAEGIKKVIETNPPGLYHLANQGICSRYEMTRKILEYARIDSCEVQAVSAADYATMAPRPAMAAVKSKHINVSNVIPPWEEALKVYLTEVKK